MRIYYITLCLFLQFAIITYSQTDNFQISRDTSPATFTHQYPKIYSNKYNGYLVAWEDFREGESAIYAQVYDSLNKPVGNNFKINSNENIYLSLDNFISLKTAYSDFIYTSNSFFNVSGTVYNKENNVVKEIDLADGQVPWCATGYFGRQPDMITTDSSFIFFYSDDGEILTARYDHSGNIISSSNWDNANLPKYAIPIAADININGNYMLAWFNVNPGNLSAGIYCTVFNSKDSVVIPSKLLLHYYIDSSKGDNVYPGMLSYLKIKNVSDSLFELYLIRSDSLKITYFTVNDKGDMKGGINEIAIPSIKSNIINSYTDKTNFQLLPVNKNTFGAAISATTYIYPDTKTANTIFYFDKNGIISENKYLDTLSLFSFNNGAVLTGINSFVLPDAEGGDIYLKYYDNSILTDSVKVNDEQSGNNQQNLFVRNVDGSKFISVWNEESGQKARYINLNGNNVGEVFESTGFSYEYFNDGYLVKLWKKRISNYYYSLGFSILNPNNEVVYEDSLLSGNNAGNINAETNIISDSTFAIASYNSSIAKVSCFDKNGKKLSEYTLPDNNIYNMHVYSENKDSLWIAWNDKLQLYSGAFEPLGQIINVSPFLYLGHNNFLAATITGINGIYSYSGCIVDAAGDTVKSNIPLAYNPAAISFANLNADNFLVLYEVNNSIYEKAFSNKGTLLLDSLRIDDGKSINKKLPGVAAAGGKVLFTWSDARNIGNGYDIYGRMLDASKITSIRQIAGTLPESFYLSQNFPNPFNPSTKIRFAVPATAGGNVKVQIKIYDILGKEIATLVNENKSAGTYEVEFNIQSSARLRNLASGIYFYQIRAGNFIDTKKLVLLK